MNSVWENLKIQKALNKVRLGEVPKLASDYILQSFQDLCEEDNSLKSQFLLKVQQIISETQSNECSRKKCLLSLAGDSNCTRSTEILFDRVEHVNTTFDVVSNLTAKISQHVSSIRSVNVILDGEYRSGVEQLKNIFEKEIEELQKLIQVTPWVVNQGINDALKMLTSKLKLADNFALQLRTSLERLMKIEQNFLKCSAELDGNYDLLCLLHTSMFASGRKDIAFFPNYNAFNIHPSLFFGNHFYAATQEVEEMAAKLGFIGFVAGHEISHSLIENPKKQFLLPYSSKEAIDCIQNQFNNTCNEFKETSCVVNDLQIDDDGSDILGLQLAYKVFENYYQHNKQEIYLQLKIRSITYQQLFFYASTTFFCAGAPGTQSPRASHSADNIRVNAYVAQHPAFQEAFQCSPDSRMMRTVEKQCLIYGEKAPANKRKKF